MKTSRKKEKVQKLTPAQQKAVEIDRKVMCITAGPGSGKTRVLVERVSSRVAAGKLDIRRTLAITFTENAAAEMKQRLADSFEKRGLEQERQALEHAWISTIHGFCMRLLRENAVEACIDPQFEVLNELHSGVLKQRALEEALEELYASDATGFLLFVSNISDRDFSNMLLRVYDTIVRLGCDPADQANLLPQAGNPLKDAALQAAATRQRAFVARVIPALHRGYSEAKRHRSALDFDDLERFTWQMLEAHQELAAAIGGKFDEILVDEYQDTSPLQNQIIRKLARHSNLFVVGDPAQSIYGFRNADPKGFDGVMKDARECGGDVDLREDFRSRPEIIRAINCHFLPAFKETETPFGALAAGSEFSGKTQPSVELFLVDGSGGVGESRPREAAVLARRIRELIESADPLRITNNSSEQLGRPLRYGDVAMLFRSAADLKKYERALEDEGVPFFSETGRGFYEAAEVRDVVAFLRVLDNSRNEVAVASVLRSPMYGISDDALLLLCDHAHRESGRVLADVLQHDVAGVPEEDRRRLALFAAALRRLRAETAWRALPELVRDIIHTTGYATTLLLAPGGRRAVANLRKLAQVADDLERAGFSTLRDFLDAVDQFRFEEVREAEAQLDAAGHDAVRVMTMHAAKGLEFPIVVVPDLTRRPPRDSDAIEFHPNYGLGVTVLNTRRSPTRSAELDLIRGISKERDAAENLRVLFVAITRAEEHLVLSGCPDAQRGNLHGHLKELAPAFGLPPRYEEIVESVKEHVAGSGDTRFALRVVTTLASNGVARKFEPPMVVTHAAALQAGSVLALPVEPAIEQEVRRLVTQATTARPRTDGSDYIASATDVVEFHRCARRYFIGRYLGFDTGPMAAADDDEEDSPDSFSRTDLGHAVHKLLAAQPADEFTPGIRAEAERLAQGFRDSEYGARLRNGSVRRELPLLAKIGDRFLWGNLDALSFRDAKPDLLLDYKSNKVDAAGALAEAEHYRVQMLLYALLAEAVYGALPREAVLYFLVPGIAVKVEITREALAEASALLEKFFEAQRSLEFPARSDGDCERCAFYGGRCRPANGDSLI